MCVVTTDDIMSSRAYYWCKQCAEQPIWDDVLVEQRVFPTLPMVYLFETYCQFERRNIGGLICVLPVWHDAMIGRSMHIFPLELWCFDKVWCVAANPRCVDKLKIQTWFEKCILLLVGRSVCKIRYYCPLIILEYCWSDHYISSK